MKACRSSICEAYAGGTAGIDRQVDDPFYGLNQDPPVFKWRALEIQHLYQREGPILSLTGMRVQSWSRESGGLPAVAGGCKRGPEKDLTLPGGRS